MNTVNRQTIIAQVLNESETPDDIALAFKKLSNALVGTPLATAGAAVGVVVAALLASGEATKEKRAEMVQQHAKFVSDMADTFCEAIEAASDRPKGNPHGLHG